MYINQPRKVSAFKKMYSGLCPFSVTMSLYCTSRAATIVFFPNRQVSSIQNVHFYVAFPVLPCSMYVILASTLSLSSRRDSVPTKIANCLYCQIVSSV